METNKAKIDRTSQPTHIAYLDQLRALSCLLVVLLHASARYAVADIGSVNFWIGNILDSMTRPAVPLFVMISGALLLDEDHPFTWEKNHRRIRKMVCFFLFWSILYRLYFNVYIPAFVQNKKVNPASVIALIIQGPAHFWFVYMIIGLYLILPLLRLWVKKDNRRQVGYFLQLSFIICFLLPSFFDVGSCFSETIAKCSTIMDKLDLQYVCGYTAYFILGWYLRQYGGSRRKQIYAAGATGAAGTILLTYALSVVQQTFFRGTYSNFSVCVLLSSIAIYVFVQAMGENRGQNRHQNHRKEPHMDSNISRPEEPGKAPSRAGNHLCQWISRYSLGIYAIHYGFIETIFDHLPDAILSHAILAIPLTFATSLLAACALSVLLGHTKHLRMFVAG